MKLGLEGKLAIVTGAGRGLGRAIAEALAAEGANLVLLDIDGPTLCATAGDIGRTVQATPLQVDVSDEQAVAAAVAAIVRQHERIDILVNNAGIASFTKIPAITVAEWDRVLAVNLRSVLLLSQAVLPIMQQQGSGVIINMASMAGKVGGLRIGAAYAASKAGIICLTKSLAQAAAPSGVRVNAVAPAFIESAMMPAAKKDEYIPLIPLHRMGTAQDVASAVVFLASQHAGFITGEVLDINGGALMD